MKELERLMKEITGESLPDVTEEESFILDVNHHTAEGKLYPMLEAVLRNAQTTENSDMSD